MLNLFPKHLEKYIIISIASIVLILDIFDYIDNSIIYETILAVLAVHLFFLIKLENRIDNLSKKETIKNNVKIFRLDSKSTQYLSNTLSVASKEIVIWEPVLININDNFNLLREKIKKECQIKILIMAKYDENRNTHSIIDIYQNTFKSKNINDALSTSYEWLYEFNSSLDKAEKRYFEVRTFNTFPTASYLFIDKDINNGFIRVKPLLHGFSLSELPNFDLDLYSSNSLYKALIHIFEETWLRSLPFMLQM